MKKKKNPFFKKDKKFNKIKIGEKISFKKLITSSSIQNYAILIGDKNPRHYKSRTNKKDKIISHGMFVGSLVSTLLGTYFPIKNNILVSISLNFKKPILPNQKVKVEGTIIEKSEAKKILIVKINIFRGNALLISGNATVKIDSR